MRHPVLRLAFGGGHFAARGALDLDVVDQLGAAERRAGLDAEYATTRGRFAGLLEALHRQAGQRVVVLVDEYDKPILDTLEMPDVARANRDYLRGLYATIKDCDAHVRFTFPHRGDEVLQGESVLGPQRGRADMAVRFGGAVYLFEFKVVEQAGEGAALAQLQARGHADKYRAAGEPIYLIGVEFSKEARNVTAFAVERV